jgi:hypothetical protein
MSSVNLVGLIIEADRDPLLREGHTKKAWVLDKLADSGLPKGDAEMLIDDIVSLVNSREAGILFRDSGRVCAGLFCRK